VLSFTPLAPLLLLPPPPVRVFLLLWLLMLLLVLLPMLLRQTTTPSYAIHIHSPRGNKEPCFGSGSTADAPALFFVGNGQRVPIATHDGRNTQPQLFTWVKSETRKRGSVRLASK
jgi:hypothetical protein